MLGIFIKVNAQWSGTGPISTDKNVIIGSIPSNSIFTVAKTPIEGEAHIFFGNPYAETKSGVASAKLTFAGTGIQHAGFAWVPNTANSNNEGKLFLSFGGYQDPMKNAIKMTFQSNGNVGVGTLSPAYKLDIQGVGQNVGIHLYKTDAVTASWYLHPGRLGNGEFSIGNDNFYALTILQNGNVGIGTTTPLHKLEVKDGDLYLNKGSMDGGVIRSRGHYLDFKGGTDSSWAHRIYRFYPSLGSSSETHSRIELYQGYTDGRFVNKVGISSDGYTYFNGGNVGIGTTAPDSKLTVKGTIHAEEVKVDLNIPAADYVFESDYALMPLSEVKQFVEEKKHLPGIPSGKEMEANGINVSEMNMLLLKKVEELTLHIIRQEKEIEELKSQFKTLQKQ